MLSAFGLQVVGVAVTIGVLALGGLMIAFWQFDRNTRKIEMRKAER